MGGQRGKEERKEGKGLRERNVTEGKEGEGRRKRNEGSDLWEGREEEEGLREGNKERERSGGKEVTGKEGT